MKKLREGYTTGSCATAASVASALWQINGEPPDFLEIELPNNKKIVLQILTFNKYVCGVKKFAGDDPDVTDGCIVKSEVKILKDDGEIILKAGEGVGTVTKKGLKICVGEPAINPVPREMIEKNLRKVIRKKSAVVTISIENGLEIAKKTFNGRLGIVGGLSILGTTGIVRPMSEEAIKDSLKEELSMVINEYGKNIVLVTGKAGENFINLRKPLFQGIILCSNYLGFMLDNAVEMGSEEILIVGGIGKLVKPAANIMNLHSHLAAGQREIFCTHAALNGAKIDVLKEIYNCVTTKAMTDILKKYNLYENTINSILISAEKNCIERVRNQCKLGLMYIENDKIIAYTENSMKIFNELR